MIITTGQVLKVEEWEKRKDTVLKYMRLQIENSAYKRDLVLGHEVVEIVEIRFNELTQAWVSAKGANITHVKVVIERQAEHA
jgi:hypothetical protein